MPVRWPLPRRPREERVGLVRHWPGDDLAAFGILQLGLRALEGKDLGRVKDHGLTQEVRLVRMKTICEQKFRVSLPVPVTESDADVRWQPPGGPQTHTTKQEAWRQVAEASAHPSGLDALLPGQVDPVQHCPAGLR